MPQTIKLPYGGQKATFTVAELISHFRIENLNYIIIGARHVSLSNHPKPNSLDVWLRKHKNLIGHEDTCQAVSKVIDDILEYEQFSIGEGKCPTSNKICKALIFSEIKQE
jgi:hypothetical protein